MNTPPEIEDTKFTVMITVALAPWAMLVEFVYSELGWLQGTSLAIITTSYVLLKRSSERITPTHLWLVLNAFIGSVLLWSLGGGTFQTFDASMRVYSGGVVVIWFAVSVSFLLYLDVLRLVYQTGFDSADNDDRDRNAIVS